MGSRPTVNLADRSRTLACLLFGSKPKSRSGCKNQNVLGSCGKHIERYIALVAQAQGFVAPQGMTTIATTEKPAWILNKFPVWKKQRWRQVSRPAAIFAGNTTRRQGDAGAWHNRSVQKTTSARLIAYLLGRALAGRQPRFLSEFAAVWRRIKHRTTTDPRAQFLGFPHALVGENRTGAKKRFSFAFSFAWVQGR